MVGECDGQGLHVLEHLEADGEVELLAQLGHRLGDVGDDHVVVGPRLGRCQLRRGNVEAHVADVRWALFGGNRRATTGPDIEDHLSRSEGLLDPFPEEAVELSPVALGHLATE